MKKKIAFLLILFALLSPRDSFAKSKLPSPDEKTIISKEQSENNYGIVSGDAVYDLKNEPIDVVIPCHPKDTQLLDRCIWGIRANGKNIRRVIVVSSVQITEQAEWFPENAFPFTKDDLLKVIFNNDQNRCNAYASNKNNRTGWMFQQLLKLYAPFVIPDISSNVLVLDADAVFLKPTAFLTPEGGAYLTAATEYFACYFEHAQRLIPNFRRVAKVSGIAHHMLFQRAILEDLLQTIETAHRVPAWQAICACIDMNEIFLSPFSEYEIYFNFCLARTKQIKLRQMLWGNVTSLKDVRGKQAQGYTFVTCHSHERKS
ncbi:MAG TPA: DUF6492 family protein [Rhabdochlamydiaceae bacterium]